ncbi:Plasmodium exported protein, unknown function, partial [Plasmodium malariae]
SNYEELYGNNTHLNNALGLRSSRLLKGDTGVQAVYPYSTLYLRKDVIDSSDNDDDYVLEKKINDLQMNSSFKRIYNTLIENRDFQKQFNDIMNNENLKKKGSVLKNLNLNEFYESLDSINSLKITNAPKNKKNKSSTSAKNKKIKLSNTSRSNNDDNVNRSESLQNMVRKALKQEKPKKGFMQYLYDLDKKFEVEMLRAMKKNTSDANYADCRFKSGYEKFLVFLDKAKIYIPPTLNMLVIMFFMCITNSHKLKDASFPGLGLGLSSFIFFAMMIYYAYKFCKMKGVHKFFKSVNGGITSKKRA